MWNRKQKLSLSVIALTMSVMLTGCGTLTDNLENRVSCAVGNDKLIYSSFYGPIAISSKVSDKDATLCTTKNSLK